MVLLEFLLCYFNITIYLFCSISMLLKQKSLRPDIMEYPEWTVIFQEAISLQVQLFVTAPIRKGLFWCQPQRGGDRFIIGFCRASLRAKNQWHLEQQQTSHLENTKFIWQKLGSFILMRVWFSQPNWGLNTGCPQFQFWKQWYSFAESFWGSMGNILQVQKVGTKSQDFRIGNFRQY